MSFAPGKVSRRRGAVPGVATLTVAHSAHADALCSALPVRGDNRVCTEGYNINLLTFFFVHRVQV